MSSMEEKYPAILKAKGKSITILDNALAFPWLCNAFRYPGGNENS